MYGAREVVAKAVALECMRGAHRQQRKCYLYAFRRASVGGREGGRSEGGSPWDNTLAPLRIIAQTKRCPPPPHPPPTHTRSGPKDVQELELGTDAASVARLLNFLTMSFRCACVSVRGVHGGREEGRGMRTALRVAPQRVVMRCTLAARPATPRPTAAAAPTWTRRWR